MNSNRGQAGKFLRNSIFSEDLGRIFEQICVFLMILVCFFFATRIRIRILDGSRSGQPKKSDPAKYSKILPELTELPDEILAGPGEHVEEDVLLAVPVLGHEPLHLQQINFRLYLLFIQVRS